MKVVISGETDSIHISLYKFSLDLPLNSIQKNWKGRVKQYPANAIIDTISIATNLIATSIAAASPQRSYTNFMRSMLAIHTSL